MATRTVVPLVDLEISNPVPPDGLSGRSAQVLLRLHGRPLGVMPARVSAGRLDLDALIPGILASHGGSLAAPLVERAIAIGAPPKWPEVTSLLACRPNALPCVPAVTVVVRASGSTPGRLRACLEAAQAVDYPSVSVIVADASTDAAALLAQADDHVVAVIDDGVLVDRGWVGSVVRVLVSDPDVAAVVGLTLPRLTTVPLPAQLVERRWHRGGHVRVEAAPGAPLAVAFWRDALDPRCVASGSRRTLEALLRDGHSIVYEPSALAWHATRIAADPCRDGGAPVSRVAVRRVDLGAAPRAIGDATAADAVRVEVAWDERRLGELDMAHHGSVVSAFRIHDAVTRALAWHVLDARLRIGQPALQAVLTAELARHLLAVRHAVAAAPARTCPTWIEPKPAAA